METVRSADGTVIAYDRAGEGPAVVLVHGAFTGRTHPILYGVAAALAPWFTVANYDRRGRGDSGDTQPYAAEREVEDLAALIDAMGGSAMVFGGSSGAALAIRAAAGNPAITRLALWEPPYHVDPSAPPIPDDFAEQLADLVRSGRRTEAAERFMVEAAEAPPGSGTGLEPLAHTLAYEAAVVGPGNALPADLLAAITQPTLVLNGDRSPAWMANAGKAVAAGISGSAHRILERQGHNVDPSALAPELLEFFSR